MYSFRQMKPFMIHTLGRHKIWPWELMFRTHPKVGPGKVPKRPKAHLKLAAAPPFTWYSILNCSPHTLGLNLPILINYQGTDSKLLRKKGGLLEVSLNKEGLKTQSQEGQDLRYEGTHENEKMIWENPFLSHPSFPSYIPSLWVTLYGSLFFLCR